MNIPVVILEQAINAKHGELKTLAEQYDYNYHSFRKAVSAYERSLADDERQSWMNAPLGRYIEESVVNQAKDTLSSISKLGAAPKPINVLNPPLHINPKSWCYASDFHAPLQDDLWVERLARVGVALGIHDLIIGGDLFDFDCLSTHGDDIAQVDINDAVKVAGEVVRYLCGVFDRLYILPGNHDRRFIKRLNKNLGWANVVRMAAGSMDGITCTDDDFILIGNKPGWAVGHPRFFSSKPTGGLHQVAMYRQKHIIGAHNHVSGVTKVNDQFITIDPGMMCRRDYTGYYMRSNGLSRFQEWSAGFVAVQDDIPQLFTDGLTRWSDYL